MDGLARPLVTKPKNLKIFKAKFDSTVTRTTIEYFCKQLFILHRVPFVIELISVCSEALISNDRCLSEFVSAKIIFRLFESLAQVCHHNRCLITLSNTATIFRIQIPMKSTLAMISDWEIWHQQIQFIAMTKTHFHLLKLCNSFRLELSIVPYFVVSSLLIAIKIFLNGFALQPIIF